MIKAGAADRALALAAARQFDQAASLLGEAASEGDPDARFALAMWRIAGTIVRRDLGIARALLAGAAASGHVDAGLIHGCFLAAGTGGPADWPAAVRQVRALAARDSRAAEQIGVIDTLDLGEDGLGTAAFDIETLDTAPRVSVARGFASPAQCGHILAWARPQLQPSMVVDPRSGAMTPHPIRTSEGAHVAVTQEDLVINALNRRIAAVTGTSLAQGEALQILSYRPGMEYKPHFDTLPAEANQRILTVLVYLSDDYEGGETRFMSTGLCFKGRKGDALLFWNVLPNGEADPAAQHAGLPVRRGTKAIASRWIRARPFVFPPPVPVTGARFG